MRVVTTIVGTKPLLMHNIQLANPDNVWAKRIAEITKLRKKTEEDRQRLAKVEWQGSLYTNDNRIVIPTTNILKCFLETAKITKEGRNVGRAVVALGIDVPLAYDGPQIIEKLAEREEFYDQTLVRVGAQRVVRTRPIFRVWGLRAEWEVLTDVLDYDSFVKIVKRAGLVEGLGDNRTNGYGRFDAEVVAVSELREVA